MTGAMKSAPPYCLVELTGKVTRVVVETQWIVNSLADKSQA